MHFQNSISRIFSYRKSMCKSISMCGKLIPDICCRIFTERRRNSIICDAIMTAHYNLLTPKIKETNIHFQFKDSMNSIVIRYGVIVLQNLITFVIYLVLILDDVGEMFQYIHNRSNEE